MRIAGCRASFRRCCPLHDREDCACRGGRRRCSTEELRDGHAANPGRPGGIIVSPSHHVFVLRQICARKKDALITTTVLSGTSPWSAAPALAVMPYRPCPPLWAGQADQI